MISYKKISFNKINYIKMSTISESSYGIMLITVQKYMHFAPVFEKELYKTKFNFKKLNDIQEQFELYLFECLEKELIRIGQHENCRLFIETERWFGFPYSVPEKNLSEISPEELDVWIFLFLSNMTNSMINCIKYPYEESFELTSNAVILEDMKKYINIFHKYEDGLIGNYTDIIGNLTINRIYEEYFQTIFFGYKHAYIKQKLIDKCKKYYLGI